MEFSLCMIVKNEEEMGAFMATALNAKYGVSVFPLSDSKYKLEFFTIDEEDK